MANDGIQQALSKAVDALSSGQYSSALTFADEALALDPASADGMLHRAIALSQLERTADAEAAFLAAIDLAPNSAKVWFNRAVHEFNKGAEGESLRCAQKALELDPLHRGALDLRARLDGEELVAPPVETSLPPAEPRPVYAVPTGPSLPFIESLGVKWRWIGWLIALTSLIGFALSMSFLIPASGFALIDPEKLQELAAKDANMQLANLFSTMSWMGAIIYTVLDTINRRTSWTWLVPQLLCSCVIGWLVMPLYLLLNRDSA